MVNKAIMRVVFFLLTFLLTGTLAASNQQSPLHQAIDTLLHEKIGDSRLNFEISIAPSSKVDSIIAHYSNVKSVELTSFDGRYMNFRVRVIYSDWKYEEVTGRYQAWIEIPTTSRFMASGELIEQQDLKYVKIKTSSVKDQYVIAMEDIIGKQTKKNIAAGAFIRKSDLLSPLVLKTKDPVNIIYHAGGIELKVTGTALGSGAAGDMVKVQNNETGAVILGKIVDKNTVQVGSK